MNDVASRCGITPQALSAIKISDDTKLKNVYLILGGLGLSISPRFMPARAKNRNSMRRILCTQLQGMSRAPLATTLLKR